MAGAQVEVIEDVAAGHRQGAGARPRILRRRVHKVMYALDAEWKQLEAEYLKLRRKIENSQAKKYAIVFDIVIENR